MIFFFLATVCIAATLGESVYCKYVALKEQFQKKELGYPSPFVFVGHQLLCGLFVSKPHSEKV